jgi:PAP2 superfamily
MWTAHEWLRWQIILVIVGFNAVVIAGRHIEVTNGDTALMFGLAGFLAFGLFYRHVRHMEPIASSVIAVAQVTIFAAVVALASYVSRTFGRPLIDDVLYAMDHSIGFDWPTAYKSTMTKPVLMQWLIWAYNSTQIQIVLLTAVLGFLGATERLDKFLLAFFVSGVITLSLWSIYPSFGAATYVHAAGLENGLPDLSQIYSYVDPLMQLQSGQAAQIDASKVIGIIGAPSFHTVMSLLTVFALSGLGVWFWLAAGWNVLVIASIPVIGGHHIMDMIAGAAVTAASIAIANRVSARMKASPVEPIRVLQVRPVAAE